LDRVPVQAVGTLWAILAAHAIFGVAIVAWVVTGAWARLDRRLVEAARLLGATPAQAFRHLTLPALAPAVGSAATLVFVFAFTSFAVVLLLGAPRLDTIEVTIYRLSTRPDLWSAAAVLALVQLLMTVAAFATRAPLHNAGHGPIEAEVRPLRSASAGERAGVALVLLVVAALVLLPLVGLIAGAFVLDGAFTTRHFAALLTAPPDAVAPAEALTWSVAFASLATLIALPAGAAAAIATARARGASRIVLGLIVWAPVAVPAVALAFAYTTMANNELIDLRGSPVLVLAAHALIAYPFVVRAVRPAAHGLAPHLEEAATVLGAAPGTAWRRLGLPMLRRALVVGAAFAFIVSFGEFGATLLLRRPEFTTAPVAVFDALSRPGSAGAGVAGALATVLIAVAVVAFVVIDRFRRHDSAEV
ncbi:MAG: ABC transporter permease, partial [Dehalococcoidia bacterium]